MKIFIAILIFVIALILGSSFLGILFLGYLAWCTSETWSKGKFAQKFNSGNATASRF